MQGREKLLLQIEKKFVSLYNKLQDWMAIAVFGK